MDEKLNFEKAKFAYESYRKEVEYVREKNWRIFTWTTTLLSGITVALMALHTKSQDFALQLTHKISLWVLVLLLAFYAYLWLAWNKKKSRLLKRKSEECLAGHSIIFPNVPRPSVSKKSQGPKDRRPEAGVVGRPEEEHFGGLQEQPQGETGEGRWAAFREWYHSYVVPLLVAAAVSALTIYWVPCTYYLNSREDWGWFARKCGCTGVERPGASAAAGQDAARPRAEAPRTPTPAP